jgi:hypothetical protein
MVTIRQIAAIKLDSVPSICFMCGKTFEGTSPSNPMSKTLNHGIPKMLKPVKNVIFPLHLECHKKLNAIYKVQERKKLIPMELNQAKMKLISAIKAKEEMDTKLMEAYGEIESLYSGSKVKKPGPVKKKLGRPKENRIRTKEELSKEYV